MSSLLNHLINVNELQASLHRAIIIDARGGVDAFDRYKKGHFPGALFVDLETQLSTKAKDPKNGGRHPMPSINSFATLLGNLGISPSSHVIIYDDKNGANAAARFWWMLKAAGHEVVQVIDGGLQSIIKHGTQLSTEIAVAKNKTEYDFKDWKLGYTNIDEVEKATTHTGKLIVDVRESYRYAGESEPIDPVAGHIPGAVNAPYLGNLNEQGEFLSPEQLRSKYEKIIGNKSPEDVIVHCGSGVTACHTLLAFEQAGITGAKLYVGSWSEWCRSGKPMVTQKDA